MKTVGASLLLACIAASGAFAWGDGGHEMVAAIAYTRLKPHARMEVDRLLSIAPPLPGELPDPPAPQDATTTFWHAAHWPDDVKHTPDYQATADEHFKDLPFTTDGTKLPKDLPKKVNVEEALGRYVATLEDKDKSDVERGVALRFIIHLVGDVHQPLHCATLVTYKHKHGDTGGNAFAISLPGVDHPELHSYWDGGLGTFPKEHVKKVGGKLHFFPPADDQIKEAAPKIAEEYPENDPGITAGGPRGYGKWVSESSDRAQDTAYQGIAEGDAPGDHYNNLGRPLARKRVAWAGYRLANLLNDVLD